MKQLAYILAGVIAATAAAAEVNSTPPSSATTPSAAPTAAPAPAETAQKPDQTSEPQPTQPVGGTSLLMGGLDKITGRPANIVAPIGKPVHFATFTITARYCYSTPPSEPPETTAFVQIEDHRPDQPARRIFSGWMYGSSPSLNAVEHPLYDVWVISCNNVAAPAAVAANSSLTAPVKVQSPDSSDKEKMATVPEEAGQ